MLTQTHSWRPSPNQLVLFRPKPSKASRCYLIRLIQMGLSYMHSQKIARLELILNASALFLMPNKSLPELSLNMRKMLLTHFQKKKNKRHFSIDGCVKKPLSKLSAKGFNILSISLMYHYHRMSLTTNKHT
jgi:hypothetical protein